jgi:glycosyltransferase involved in cell wall biosynthesis
MNQKLLFITPHLSTGGLPQFLLKKIEVLINDFDIYCIEWDNITGGVLVVQRSQIERLLDKKLITLSHNKEEVLDIISSIDPDIIHFEEFPETFISSTLLRQIYNLDIKICETTHGTLFNPSDKITTPDKMMFISKGNVSQYKKICGDFDVVTYPTKNKDVRNHFIDELGLDRNKFHILNVGLFNSNKNQGEIFEYARYFTDDVQFHFVGSQAMNFADYWSPLLEKKSNNCIIWGERSDAFKFYAISDLFLFTSKLENKPLCVKEAINNNIPVVMRYLPNYKDEYSNQNVTFLSDNFEENLEILKGIIPSNFQKNNTINNISCYHILTDIDTDREVNSMMSLTRLKDFGIKYTPCINKRYTELPPSENCEYPEKISMYPGDSLTPGHYGCYLSHRNAITKGIEENSDFILIFECDCVIDTTIENFISNLNLACDILNKKDLLMFSLGYHNNTNIIETNKSYLVVDKFYGAHAYLIPKKSYGIILDMYNNSKWNVTDLLYSEKLSNFKTGIFEQPITKQSGGISILDNIHNEDRY